jgi:4-hydroxy-4-methyl-2-oxoglutarate aldolase
MNDSSFPMSGEDRVGGFAPGELLPSAFERVAPDIVRSLRMLSGLSATVSDVLDEQGWQLVVERDRLPLRTPIKGPVIGQAITLAYLPARRSILDPQQRSSPAKLAHATALATGRPGDVLVIDARGARGISALGALGASAALGAGFAGCIVDGGVRDLDDVERLGFAVWSRWVTPRTGKWRIEAQSINSAVSVGGVQVVPGDLVVADETGVCFVPYEAIERVIPRVIEVAEQERRQLRG